MLYNCRCSLSVGSRFDSHKVSARISVPRSSVESVVIYTSRGCGFVVLSPFTQDVEYCFSCSHLAPPHRTLSHSFTCLLSPCKWLSHFPWSVVTPTSTMETPYPYGSHHLGHPMFRFTISVIATLRLPLAHPYPASLAGSPPLSGSHRRSIFLWVWWCLDVSQIQSSRGFGCQSRFPWMML